MSNQLTKIREDELHSIIPLAVLLKPPPGFGLAGPRQANDIFLGGLWGPCPGKPDPSEIASAGFLC
jgi:hypothetical protein